MNLLSMPHTSNHGIMQNRSKPSNSYDVPSFTSEHYLYCIKPPCDTTQAHNWSMSIAADVHSKAATGVMLCTVSEDETDQRLMEIIP